MPPLSPTSLGQASLCVAKHAPTGHVSLTVLKCATCSVEALIPVWWLVCGLFAAVVTCLGGIVDFTVKLVTHSLILGKRVMVSELKSRKYLLGASGGEEGGLVLFYSWILGSGGELLDGTVVVLGGEGLQGAPAVCMQLDDLHEQRASQLRFGRTEHLVPDSR